MYKSYKGLNTLFCYLDEYLKHSLKMKNLLLYNKIILFFTTIIFIISCNKSKNENDDYFFPGKVWVDNNGIAINAHGGGILFYDNTYFWYGEHKIEGKIGNTAQVGVHLYSSKNLYKWKDEGIVLRVNETDPSSDIYKGNVDYSKGICPVAEMLVEEKIMIISICDYEFSDQTIDIYINGFKKIWSNLDKLKSL